MRKQLNVAIVVAHPDDCEWASGGTAIRYRRGGHRVVFISLTNGNAGHYEMAASDLQQRRAREAKEVARLLDVDYEIMDIQDGALVPTLENRIKLIRLLRRYKPDVIITHPQDDYHPDHRYAAQLVCDTAYMLNVPLCVPDAPAMNKPVAYCHISLKPDDNASTTILVPVDDVIEQKYLAIHQNASQFYEWIPWTMGIAPAEVPTENNQRMEFLQKTYGPEWKKIAENYRAKLALHSGSEAVYKLRYVEAYVVSFCDSTITAENVREYFPFPDAVIF